MINRQVFKVDLYSDIEDNDEEIIFGQEVTATKIDTIEVAFYEVSTLRVNENAINSPLDMINYDSVILTNYNGLDKNMYFIVNSKRYNIVRFINSRRFTQVFLKGVE